MPREDCSWELAQMTSETLTGEIQPLAQESWTIKALPYRYIFLQFNAFHIECGIQSSLEVELTEGGFLSLCNHNRANRGLKSVRGQIVVNFRFIREEDRMLEGFTATYEMIEKPTPAGDLLTLEGGGA